MLRGAGPVYKLVRTSRLYEQIVQQIEESIVKGDLKAGDQLPAERELAPTFRSEPHRGARSGEGSARKRLGRSLLRARNLHHRWHYAGGAAVAGPDGEDRSAGRVNSPCRSARDPGAGDCGAWRLRAFRSRNWRPCAKRSPSWIAPGKIRTPTSKPISIFIWRWRKAPRIRLILSLLDSIVGLLREQRLRIFRVPGGPERGQVHHKRILEAVERHDAEKAREAMRAHLVASARRQPGAGSEAYSASRAVIRTSSKQFGGSKRMAKVGFIGLGVMGSQMVNRLLSKGHSVTGYNRTRAKAQWLVEKGMQWADSPRAGRERFGLSPSPW